MFLEMRALSIRRLGTFTQFYMLFYSFRRTTQSANLVVLYRAGAHWLPHSRAHEPVICDWDVQTYDYWLDMIRQEEEDGKSPVSVSGIKVHPISSTTSKQIIPANHSLLSHSKSTRTSSGTNLQTTTSGTRRTSKLSANYPQSRNPSLL
jgi:hypothetical protein